MNYVFTLKYQLAPDDCDQEQLVERLAQGGCDDATIGVGLPGRIALAFARESESAWAAIYTALQNVKEAVPSARLVEAAPDFVGLTDVADLTGMSRQNMRKLMLAHFADFPQPVHEGSPSLWHLGDILSWLSAREGYSIDAALLDTACTAKQVNLAKDAREVDARVKRQLAELVS
ncbi:AlpA family transcriptional regulator [Paraburkholderia eburnea]|uniref:AlpA family transcriptional regulator n=1 Tax=Paraburkholderia eburnea TaxID=1189126 RepID=A0A2S4MGM0_9BURK|nr:DNA-binding protein [Paraburkholderia eburnea]POR53811.1 AlpA family transcriptional regulator [Paraburkholderia eburnea]PRZ25779.1 AlpA family transcriptional regulator [Paraburkholderia eburnea]